MHIFTLSGIGFFAGIIGTGLGGLIAIFASRGSKRILSAAMSFAAGLMLYVTCFDLLPESIHLANNFTGFIGCVMGFLFMLYVESIVKTGKTASKKNRMYVTGVLAGIGIALHNFPEGLAIGAGFEASVSLGIKLLIAIALHDIPEGIAMGMPLKLSGVKGFNVVMLTLLAGVPTAFGTLIGKAVGNISPAWISLSLSFAAGAMLHVVFSDLLPESNNIHRGRFNVAFSVIGLLTGILLPI